jgi:hypothetical protein
VVAAQSRALGCLGGRGDDTDVDVLAGKAAEVGVCDPDVFSAVSGEDGGFQLYPDTPNGCWRDPNGMSAMLNS